MTINHPTNHIADHEKGTTIVEMIVYIALLSIVMSAFVVSAVSLLKTYAHMRATEDVTETARIMLERITRELRFAESVNVGASTLDTSPGTLVLNSVDAADNPTTYTIALQGTTATLTEDSGVAVPLSRQGVTVSNLAFFHSSNAESEGVRVEMTVEKTVKNLNVSKTYRTFVGLDG